MTNTYFKYTHYVPWPVVTRKTFFKDVILDHCSTSKRERCFTRTEMVRNEGVYQAWNMHIIVVGTQ